MSSPALRPTATSFPIRLVALSDDLAGPDRRYRSAVGDWQQTWQAVREGGVLDQRAHGQPLRAARGRHAAHPDRPRAKQAFPIVGITVDFDVRSVVFIDDPVYRQLGRRRADLGDCALRGAGRRCGQHGADAFAPTWPASRNCWCAPTAARARMRWRSSTAPSPSRWRCNCWRPSSPSSASSARS